MAARVVPQVGWLASAGLGSLLGMRHALEPDHLAAVSTLVTGERSSAKAAWLGACWGLGHTLTLLAAGAVLVVWRTEMPAGAAEVFELGVVLLLVGFGVRAIHQGVYRGPTGPTHTHADTGPGAAGRSRWMDARATAARRRRPRTRRQRRAHRAGRRDAALDRSPGSATWRCSAWGRPRAWRCYRDWSAGRSPAWPPIRGSRAASRWRSAPCRPCSASSGATRSSRSWF